MTEVNNENKVTEPQADTQVEPAQESQAVTEGNQTEADKIEDSEFDDVDLSKFDLEDVEDFKETIVDLTKKKRKAYAQAKKERETKEALEAELERIRSEKMTEVNEEIAKLKAELEAKEKEVSEALALAQAERNRQADLQFSYAAEKHNVAEKEYIQFQLGKHLKALEPEQLDAFNIDSWMADMKDKHPAMFGGEPKKEAATSGAPPAEKGSAQYDTNAAEQAGAPRTSLKKLNSGWAEYRKSVGI